MLCLLSLLIFFWLSFHSSKNFRFGSIQPRRRPLKPRTQEGERASISSTEPKRRNKRLSSVLLTRRNILYLFFCEGYGLRESLEQQVKANGQSTILKAQQKELKEVRDDMSRHFAAFNAQKKDLKEDMKKMDIEFKKKTGELLKKQLQQETLIKKINDQMNQMRNEIRQLRLSEAGSREGDHVTRHSLGGSIKDLGYNLFQFFWVGILTVFVPISTMFSTAWNKISGQEMPRPGPSQGSR